MRELEQPAAGPLPAPGPNISRPSQRLLLPVLGAIVVLAWLTLWWLEQSSFGGLFHRHGGGAHAHHGRTAGSLATLAFLAGWLLMTIAMMLPTTVPLADQFRRMISQRTNTTLLSGLLLAGYLTAWLVFGLAALLLLAGIDNIIARSDWLAAQPWVTGAGLFLLAGAFQFTTLKYACLDKCRSPTGFLISHWHGRNEQLESFNIGWRHGLFCVGCCWALMLLMFAVSTASLLWMLVLALIMAIEKNMPWGRRISRPLGWTLLATGVLIGIYHLVP